MHLLSGYQEIAAIGLFQGNSNPTALKTLTDFVNGKDNVLTISGFNGSTAIDSLGQAFASLHLNATLKGLTSKLVNFANVQILPTTGITNNLAASVVSIQNPFTSPLHITNIQVCLSSYSKLISLTRN